jgi:hypothetical protein
VVGEVKAVVKHPEYLLQLQRRMEIVWESELDATLALIDDHNNHYWFGIDESWYGPFEERLKAG